MPDTSALAYQAGPTDHGDLTPGYHIDSLYIFLGVTMIVGIDSLIARKIADRKIKPGMSLTAHEEWLAMRFRYLPVDVADGIDRQWQLARMTPIPDNVVRLRTKQRGTILDRPMTETDEAMARAFGFL